MIAKIFKSGNSMALRLPKSLSPKPGRMEIEVTGEGWVVTPVKTTKWPKNFFKRIRISNPSFRRQPQGRQRRVDL